MKRSAIDEANQVQTRAAAPHRSVILRAAAGAGKTRVLVDRFVRLCVSGVPARSILAVTFTRKAAIEIRQRIFARARRYARATPAELRRYLTQLMGEPPSDRQTERAAWLYEQLLDDAGNLQVGTIHSFCQRVLERFAVQAGVDPHFAVLEDEQELWEEAIERLAADIAADADLRADVDQLGLRPEALAAEIRRLRDDRTRLQRWLGRVRAAADPPSNQSLIGQRGDDFALLPWLLADLRGALFAGTMLAGAENPNVASLVPAATAALRRFAGEGLDGVVAAETADQSAKFPEEVKRYRGAAVDLADRLESLAAASATVARELIAAGAELLLTKERDRLRAFTGKRATHEARQAAFAAAAAPFLDLWALVDLVDLYRWNRSLLRLGLRALDIYTALKRRDRLVDFHDLEHLTWALMRDPDVGPWIQYRLDTTLDHLLVDEFQDTNRNQWEILEPLVEEILAGYGDRPRSVFLVGDIKQSIYGFRGAAPGIFREIQARLASHPAVDQLTLPTNFRSQPAVVATLGALFNAEPLATIIGQEEAGDAVQLAARPRGAAEVVFVEPLPASDEGSTADERAAGATAALVRHLVATEMIDVAEPGAPPRRRPLNYGDILVLCRRRTQITWYEQALRRAQLPIVPAGRGLLARSREVQDVLALLRWLAYPADDIALAAVLRSPLIRAAEKTVQRALGARLGAAGAPRDSLWGLLRQRGDAFGLGEPAQLLQGWLSAVGKQDVHALLRRIYRESDALDRFAAALGEQARFNLLRLLDLALSAELGPAPTLRRLTAVIERAERTGGEQEGNAPPNEAGGRVRLMTVHAAKGLEAPVVILVDAAAPLRGQFASQQLPHGHRPLVYGLRRHHRARPDRAETRLQMPLAEAIAARTEADMAEEAHILYVALSRARDRLYVLGGMPSRAAGAPSFLDWLKAASDAGEADASSRPYRFESGAWVDRLAVPSVATREAAAVATTSTGEATAPPPAGQPTVAWRPPSLRQRIELVVPSRVDGTSGAAPGAAVDPDPGLAAGAESEALRSAAVSRGSRIHLLLQLATERGVMPPLTSAATESAAVQAWEEAAAVFGNPAFAWIFQTGAETRGLCEMPVIARLSGDGPERRLVGVIDRLVIGRERIDVIDYKSNRAAADPEQLDALVQQYHGQLATYRDVVRTLYREREIRSWLLFTHPNTAQGRGVLREVV